MNSILMQKIAIFLILTHGMCKALEGELKLRGGAFLPASKFFRCIYGNAGGIVEVEGALSVCGLAHIWANINWFSKHGRSLGFCNPTNLRVPSFSFGIKAPFNVCDWVKFYLGTGPTFSSVSIKNSSLCGCECFKKGSIGIVLKSGINMPIGDCGFFDLFFDYVNQSLNSAQDTEIRGFRIGVGLGRRFS